MYDTSFELYLWFVYVNEKFLHILKITANIRMFWLVKATTGKPMMMDFSFISVEYLKSTKLALLLTSIIIIDIIFNAAKRESCASFGLEFCMSGIYLLRCIILQQYHWGYAIEPEMMISDTDHHPSTTPA